MTIKAVSGTVEALYENTANTRNGPATTYALKVDGQRYSAGFKPLGCNEGDVVEFNIKQRGDFWNLDGAVKVVGSAPAAPAQPHTAAAPKKAVNWEEKDRRITFLSCRNTAIALVKMMIDVNALDVKGKNKEELVLGYVQKYSDEFFIESWVDEGYKNLTSLLQDHTEEDIIKDIEEE